MVVRRVSTVLPNKSLNSLFILYYIDGVELCDIVPPKLLSFSN